MECIFSWKHDLGISKVLAELWERKDSLNQYDISYGTSCICKMDHEPQTDTIKTWPLLQIWVFIKHIFFYIYACIMLIFHLFKNNTSHIHFFSSNFIQCIFSFKVPHRLMTFQLTRGIEVCVICGPSPSLTDLEPEVSIV